MTLVGMESTGVYWKSLFYLLEDSVHSWLLNAEHLHNVPGKKTDVADSACILGRRGRAKAVGAVRHDILVAYYFIVRDGVVYRDLGADWAARRFSREHRQRRVVKQLEALGLRVTVEPMEAA